MTPRKVLTSVGYAFRASTVESIGSHTHSGADITSGTVSEPRIDPLIARDSEVTGAVNAHASRTDNPHSTTAAQVGALALNQANSITSGMIVDGTITNADISANANIDFSKLSGVASSTHNHDAAYVNVTGDTMMGALNLPTNGLNVGTNQLVVSGGKVGVGTATPNEQLEITGNLRLPGTTSTTGIIKSGTNTLIHTYGTDNFFAGVSAGNLTMTGTANSAMGQSALISNTTGGGNTASGSYALFYNTTGYGNTASGSYALYHNTTGYVNTASGDLALCSNTEGSYNTANGSLALFFNTTGNNNTASGYWALYSNTTGSYNTASGYEALSHNTTGHENTASGYEALSHNTTGSYNTASGYEALSHNTTGHENTASGYGALFGNTTGNNNTASGTNALFYNTTGYSNTASGWAALLNNTTGYENTASGWAALFGNTTGNNNTASGTKALFNNTTGNNNTASGWAALYSNTTGNNNTASGWAALSSNTTGNNNTASGYEALVSNTEGVDNTASGYLALSSNTTGIGNTAIGYQALYNNTTSNFNTAIGDGAGYSNRIGFYNTFIGPFSDAAADNLTDATALGSGAIVDASNHMRIGDTYITHIGGQVGFSNDSDIREKKDIKDIGLGLEFINSLRPVEFRMINGNDRIDFGFIAQEIEALLGTDYNILGIGGGPDRMLSLRYTDFIAPMVRAIQEQQAYIKTLEERLARLEALLGIKP